MAPNPLVQPDTSDCMFDLISARGSGGSEGRGRRRRRRRKEKKKGKEKRKLNHKWSAKFLDSPGMGKFGADPSSSVSFLSCSPVTGR